MADQIIRDRATYKGETVTVIERGKLKTTIRNQFGFIEQVKTKDLGKLDGDVAKLKFEET